ncbi:MAG: CsgG/HfaB family protein [Spirochaetia bacterium]
MKNRPHAVLLSALFLMFLGLVPCVSQPSTTTVAVLPFENTTADLRSDYLGKIAEALLMYDLSSVSSLQLVSREEIDALLQEKKLALSGLFEGSGDASEEIESLTSADYLLRGEFVHLGDELIFILKLLRVSDGEATVFRERGTDENTIHRLSEQAVHSLTGRSLTFTTEDGSRSIISMRNEEPGILAVYSPLINAEIFIDDSFVGYTTGDPTEPFIADKLRPGLHTVRTHLSRNFGVIDLPEIKFHDWETEVRVRPGQRAVVRDQSRHFNDILYSLQWVLREEKSFRSKTDLLSFNYSEDFSFVDRRGETMQGTISYRPAPIPGTADTTDTRNDKASEENTLLVEVQLNEAAQLLQIPIPPQGSVSDQNSTLQLLDIEIGIDARYNDWELSYSIRRNDVYQGMHRVEYD